MLTFPAQQRNELVRHLQKHVSGEVRFDVPSRKLWATDASIYQIEPLGVVLPRSADDVRAVLQIAGEMKLSVTPRGGGTSLSGQAVGPGVVLDCSKYMADVLDIDPVRKVARVQPGVVLDQLNAAVGEHGLFFGPDVSTSSRATLGGMIGNNSAGSRSIVYGKTIDHVVSLDVILADGSKRHFRDHDARAWDRLAAVNTAEGRLYRDIRDLARRYRDEIETRFPKLLRRVSGYNLDELVRLIDGTGQTGLHRLLVGSEGTLAVMTEAEVNLVAKPAVRGLLVPQFATLASSMDALAVCLAHKPSAVELMDRLLLELTGGNLALRDTTRNIDKAAHAIFMVEFSGDDVREVTDRVERLSRDLQGVPGLLSCVPAIDPSVRDPLWNLRKASMPLLYSMPGDKKPITFVEDTAVPPEKLPAFTARFKDILHKHGTDGSFYGHASVGCLHIRPVMNLKDAADVRAVQAITEEVTDLVLEFGGALSGEHGDGLTRSVWNRKMFGDALYGAFGELKRLFDPGYVLNPGKITDGQPMTDNLRYPPDRRTAEPPTVFDYSKQEGFLRSIEMCNGNGACRKTAGGTMCPSYRATRDEADSTRGRANALRHALLGEPGDPEPPDAMKSLRQDWVHQVFDLCLQCKACKSECPSNVDVGKLKSEFLQFRYRGRPRPLEHLLVAGLPYFNRLAAPLAPVVNPLQSSRLFRRLLQAVAGIDARRSLPALHRDHFRRRFARRPTDPRAGTAGKVLLLADCFTTYNEPDVGTAAVRVLERAGYKVELADAFCCGRVLVSKGMLDRAKTWVRSQVSRLASAVADGTPILGLEPSCILALADEWPELLPGESTRLVAASAHLADVWLAGKLRAGEAKLPLLPSDDACVVHGHCHQKALLGNASSGAAARQVPGLGVEVLDAGCCGMAGSFGFEAAHYDVSVKIANLALVPALAERPGATVVAPGTSCRHQIRDLTGRKALHPMELLHERLPPG